MNGIILDTSVRSYYGVRFYTNIMKIKILLILITFMYLSKRQKMGSG